MVCYQWWVNFNWFGNSNSYGYHCRNLYTYRYKSIRRMYSKGYSICNFKYSNTECEYWFSTAAYLSNDNCFAFRFFFNTFGSISMDSK